MRPLRSEERSGRPIDVRPGLALVPIARSLRFEAPAGKGGAIWSRPAGIRVEEGGESRFVAIPDRTRQVQWLLWGAGLAAALAIRWGRARG